MALITKKNNHYGIKTVLSTDVIPKLNTTELTLYIDKLQIVTDSLRKIDEKFFKELNIEQLKGNMTYELIVKNDFKDDKCEINNEDCFKPQKIYFYCK